MQHGLLFPQIVVPKEPIGSFDNEHLTVNGTKPRAVKPFKLDRNIMLPHISQKSPRPVPQLSKNLNPVSQVKEGPMLEAIEIYRRSRVVHSPDKVGEIRGTNPTVPHPTPMDTNSPPTPEKSITFTPRLSSYRNQRIAVDITNKSHRLLGQQVPRRQMTGQETYLKKPTTMHQPPVVLTLQKRLEKLAKYKSNTLKNSKHQPHEEVKLNSKSPLPAIKLDTSVKHMHYHSKVLPRAQKYIRKPSMSYQYLEVPAEMGPSQNQKTMFTHSHYNLHQHERFAGRINDKKLSIVAGPESRLNAVWDYNNFLYLNVKV